MTDRLFFAPAPAKRAAALVAAAALGLAGLACMPNVHTLVIAVSPKVYVGDPNGARVADGQRVTATKPAAELSEDELLDNLRSFENEQRSK